MNDCVYVCLWWAVGGDLIVSNYIFYLTYNLFLGQFDSMLFTSQSQIHPPA